MDEVVNRTPEQQAAKSAYMRAYWKKNPDKYAIFLEKQKIKAYTTGKNLKQYGFTLDQYEVLNQSQNGKCKICGNRNRKSGQSVRLAVDHDHVTGRIRGLLCNTCNRGLGMFRDDAGLLQTAADYLRL